MDSTERLQKNIGIVLGCIVIFAVATTTFFEERGTDIVTAAATPTASDTPSPVATDSPSPAVDSPKPTSAPSIPVTSSIPVATPAITPKQTASVYTDGTYSATGSYMSPGGEDQISVTLTLANDIITSVSVTPAAGDRTSARYQNAFISGYKQYVVGKNIRDVNLTRVSGSSLTPVGFDNALAQIKEKAKA